MSSKNPRRLLAAVAVLAVIPLLAACGSNGGVGGASNAAQVDSGPVTLQYWTWYPDAKTLQPALDAFHKANPNITVKLRMFTNTDYQKQLPLALNGGEKIDVVGVQVSAMTKTVQGQLRPVDSYAKSLGDYKRGIDPNLLAQTQAAASDKVLYELPMGAVSSAIMYYNADTLKKAGIAVPKTADELAAATAKLKAQGEAQPVVQTGDGWWQEEVLFSIAGQTDPKLSDSIFLGKASWNQPSVVNALKDYKSLFASGALKRSVLSLTGSAPAESFSSGKSAFLIDGSWQASMLSADYRKANSISLTDVGAIPVPVVRTNGQPAVRGLAEGGMGIPKASTHVAAAAKFIAYMTFGGGVDVWNKNLVFVPTAKVGFMPADSTLNSQAAKDGFAAIQTVSATPGSERTSQQDFLTQVEGPAILDVLRGNITPEAAATKLQSEWASGRYPRAGK